MTLDLVVVGSSFLDLTFEGLDGLPEPGQEALCRRLHFSPGGSPMTAIGASRLGLRAGLISPIGTDTAGGYLLSMLSEESVEWLGPEVTCSAVTVVLPWAEDRAMATFNPGFPVGPADVAGARTRGMVLPLLQHALAPDGAQVYAVTGYPEVTGAHGPVAMPEHPVHAIITNEFEGLKLTDTNDAEEAARALSQHAKTAVVTRGPDGAVAASGGEVAAAAAPEVIGRDTTGAGDLFVAAYVWADLQGMSLQDRLSVATLYAGLSVQTYTPLAGAVRMEDLKRAAAERGVEVQWAAIAP